MSLCFLRLLLLKKWLKYCLWPKTSPVLNLYCFYGCVSINHWRLQLKSIWSCIWYFFMYLFIKKTVSLRKFTLLYLLYPSLWTPYAQLAEEFQENKISYPKYLALVCQETLDIKSLIGENKNCLCNVLAFKHFFLD